eukprot:CAMPEP_0119059722 /NCGR_PEP_ID=MMETSP1178-20130426/3793_1 /TAXON_ID=33656 /ORGANISM="unid sp, Strain CCMP2000" /LENGTH=46 /DNA_ID= /DNA_START= /DNA_END= /DNA_ORIENTATION=
MRKGHGTPQRPTRNPQPATAVATARWAKRRRRRARVLHEPREDEPR